MRVEIENTHSLLQRDVQSKALVVTDRQGYMEHKRKLHKDKTIRHLQKRVDDLEKRINILERALNK